MDATNANATQPNHLDTEPLEQCFGSLLPPKLELPNLPDRCYDTQTSLRKQAWMPMYYETIACEYRHESPSDQFTAFQHPVRQPLALHKQL